MLIILRIGVIQAVKKMNNNSGNFSNRLYLIKHTKEKLLPINVFSSNIKSNIKISRMNKKQYEGIFQIHFLSHTVFTPCFAACE